MSIESLNERHRFSDEQRRALANMTPDLRELIGHAWASDGDTAADEPHFPAEWLEQHK
jgi:hypothetical protein